jgi:transcriptional regulatory protein RtcR
MNFASTARPARAVDAWDFEGVYGALFDFAKEYPFNPDNEEYWIHITRPVALRPDCPALFTRAG